MAALGFLSPFSLPLGGGTSHIEDVYTVLRSAAGTAVGPAHGLEDTWRQCKANGIGLSQEALDRAAFQALPQSTTDHLEVYERILALTPAAGDDEQTRREAVSVAWSNALDTTLRGIEIALQDIDSAFSLLGYDSDTSETTVLGRWFPSPGDEISRGTSNYPNHSTDYWILASYALPGNAVLIDVAVRSAAARLLSATIPAWCLWQITQTGSTGGGFYCDGGADGTSALDITGL